MSEEKQLTPEQKWEQATIANNFIFYKVMRHNPDVCKELLEILLEMKIDHIDMKQEEEIDIDYGKKSIRLDVYAVGTSNAFNLEMQSTDTGNLPERSRYYQSVLDVDDLNAGANYKDLKTSYIIFICIPDIFEKGLAKYSFENICRENTEVKLNDRAFKYFFIAENYDKILNAEQKAFLKLLISNEATNSFSDKIVKLVADAKHNTQWRRQFMYFQDYIQDSFDQGKKEGLQEKTIEDAKSFYANGVSIELIANSLNMTIEQVKEIVCDVKVLG